MTDNSDLGGTLLQMFICKMFIHNKDAEYTKDGQE